MYTSRCPMEQPLEQHPRRHGGNDEQTQHTRHEVRASHQQMQREHGADRGGERVDHDERRGGLADPESEQAARTQRQKLGRLAGLVLRVPGRVLGVGAPGLLVKAPAIGCGVVLIGEGPRTRTQPMLDKERANVRRILPEVPVHLIYVDKSDPEATSLHRIVPTLSKYKRVLNKSEIQAVSNRLQSLGKNGLPIPKGIDPQRVRAPRPR